MSENEMPKPRIGRVMSTLTKCRPLGDSLADMALCRIIDNSKNFVVNAGRAARPMQGVETVPIVRSYEADFPYGIGKTEG